MVGKHHFFKDTNRATRAIVRAAARSQHKRKPLVDPNQVAYAPGVPVPLGRGVTPRDVLNKIAPDYGPLAGDMTLLETAAAPNPVDVQRPITTARPDGASDVAEPPQPADHDRIREIIEEDAAQRPTNPRRLHLTPTMRRLMSGDLSALDPQNRPFSPNLLRMLMGGRAHRVKGATRLHDIARPQGNRFER